MGFFFEWVIILKPVITINLCMLLCDGWLQPIDWYIDFWTNKRHATVRPTKQGSYGDVIPTRNVIFTTNNLLRTV